MQLEAKEKAEVDSKHQVLAELDEIQREKQIEVQKEQTLAKVSE